MIFVDTSAWFASIVPTDPNHDKAAEWLQSNNEVLFTTDYIVDETLTLLRARGENRRAISLGTNFFDGQLAVVYRLSENDIARAWDVFQQFSDKEWSFTDCTSKAVMESSGITSAFAFDKHFTQFGVVVVVP
ncbi:MAG: type II toxin-antitoxin system VapC family toxin [Pyrinomonadaceae bacterium]